MTTSTIAVDAVSIAAVEIFGIDHGAVGRQPLCGQIDEHLVFPLRPACCIQWLAHDAFGRGVGEIGGAPVWRETDRIRDGDAEEDRLDPAVVEPIDGTGVLTRVGLAHGPDPEAAKGVGAPVIAAEIGRAHV